MSKYKSVFTFLLNKERNETIIKDNKRKNGGIIF